MVLYTSTHEYYVYYRGVGAPQVTPFLLKRINELTGGESLRANIALVKHNAEVGALVAKELAMRSRL